MASPPASLTLGCAAVDKVPTSAQSEEDRGRSTSRSRSSSPVEAASREAIASRTRTFSKELLPHLIVDSQLPRSEATNGGGASEKGSYAALFERVQALEEALLCTQPHPQHNHHSSPEYNKGVTALDFLESTQRIGDSGSHTGEPYRGGETPPRRRERGSPPSGSGGLRGGSPARPPVVLRHSRSPRSPSSASLGGHGRAGSHISPGRSRRREGETKSAQQPGYPHDARGRHRSHDTSQEPRGSLDARAGGGLLGTSPDSVDNSPTRRAAPPPPQLSLMEYIYVEVMGAEDHGTVDTKVNRTVRNFISVPKQLERLLFFGLLVCVDTFLYVTTFLPLRIVFGVGAALTGLLTKRRNPLNLSQAILYDCMRGGMVVAALCALQMVNMSFVYHYIRGQAMIKLYVLIAMIEIFDKLMCSFGQDALDSLYLSTCHSQKRRILPHYAVMCAYVMLHAALLFLHVTTLTVAVNSDDQALLTLLISNNFAEIKSSVFKKFDAQNLFQLCCHDIVERFKLILFLSMILLLNVVHGGEEDLLGKFLNIFILVFGGEVLADWIKHAFIAKFNQLQPSLYAEYSDILVRDITACRKDDARILDHTHAVSRRLAFATLPLNCVMLRFLQIAAPQLRSVLPDCPPYMLFLLAFVGYLCLVGIKVLTGIAIMTWHPLTPEVVARGSTPWLRSPAGPRPVGPRSKKDQKADLLASVNRFTLWKGRIV